MKTAVLLRFRCPNDPAPAHLHRMVGSSGNEAREKEAANQLPLTQWLREAGSGDLAASGRAYALVYSQLRRIAARQLGRDPAQTLTPTALVSEAFLKLSEGTRVDINDRRHFFSLAARAIRQTVIDHARERLAQKRGGGLLHAQLDEAGVADPALDAEQALAIDQALNALDGQDSELAEMISWRVFAGLSTAQIAQLRGVSERTVQRELGVARNYLRLALGIE